MEAKRAGHPMDKDLIVVFCNPHNRHWFLIIVDNREGRKGVVFFDSGRGKSNISNIVIRKTCKKYIDFINNYSQYLSSTYKNITDPGHRITPQSHPFINGKSTTQQNFFDCGVFTLANLDAYIHDQSPTLIQQEHMTAIRAHIMKRLLEHGQSAGYID